MLQHDCTDEYHRDVCHKGCARVHEYTDEDGHHGIRQQVDMNECVAHEQCRQYGKDDDKGIEHCRAARFLEIVLSIEAEVDGKAEDEDGHIDNLTK